MKNLMKVLVVLMALGAVISCKKTEVVQHITHPGIFAAYATIVNGVSISPSAENPRPIDSSSVGGTFKAAVNIEINNTDSVISLDCVWFKAKANGDFISTLDSLHYNGDIKHITQTVVLTEVKGVNIYDDNFKSIKQYYGSIAIPVGKHITIKGLYGFQATIKTAKQAVTLLPVMLIQIN